MDFSRSEREEGFIRQLRGEAPGPEGSVLKLTLTGGRWASQALFALRFGIAGGATEIQKNMVGERILGLPKG